MNKHRSHFVTLLSLLANVVSLHTLFILFSYPRFPVSDTFGLLIWWGCLTATYLVLAQFLRQPRSLRSVILISAGGFFLQLTFTLIFAHRHSTVLAWSILLFMWLVMYCRCCNLLLEGIKPESVIAAFETTVVMLFVSAFAVTLSVMETSSFLFTAIGVLFSLVALVCIRSNHARITAQAQFKQKGSVFLIAFLMAIGGCASILCLLITNPASRLLTRLTQWFFSVLRSIAGTINRFLRWLASLLPEQHVDEALINDPNLPLLGGATEWGTMNSQIPLFMMLALLVIFLLLALFWLWRHGGLHTLSFRVQTTGHVVRKRHSSKHLLLQLWKRFSRWITFQNAYLKQRNTAPGLFVWLERQMQARHMERKENETPRAFLFRLQNHFPNSAETISYLASCLDQHYFGTGSALPAAKVAQMRKQLAHELHQQ